MRYGIEHDLSACYAIMIRKILDAYKHEPQAYKKWLDTLHKSL